HRPNLLLTIEGALPGPHLGVCGHLDTKPAGDAIDLWKTNPLGPVIVGDRLYGLGSTDMKGAIAAMLHAAIVLNETRHHLRGDVTFAFTADEEYGSLFGAHHLVQVGALDVDAMILGEPSGIHADWDALRTVSRGCACFRIILRGTQMHSSISDLFSAVSAVEAMGRVMSEFRKHFRPRFTPHPLCPSGPTINIGVRAEGGVGYGVTPGYAEFLSDVRLVPGMIKDEFIADIESALDKCQGVLNGAELTLDFDPEIGWSDATEIEANHPAVVAAELASQRVLGHPMPLAYFPGGTDAIAFQAIAGIPTVAAFGPGQLPLAHGPNEWVSCSSLRQAMRMYAHTALAYGLLGSGGADRS
ncbi:MAG: M20 family metallopeptidase, partial [Thermomicrobiales bacterium]